MWFTCIILFNLIQPHIIIIMIPLKRFANRGPQNPKQLALGPSWHQEDASPGDKTRININDPHFLGSTKFFSMSITDLLK